MTGASDKGLQLALVLLKSVEAHDPQAITKALNRTVPNHTKWLIAYLAVVAFVNIKQNHGTDWPNHIARSLITYNTEAQ